MPHAAPVLAEIAVGQPDEPVAPGLGEHALQQRAGVGLAAGTLGQRRARAVESVDELIAEDLQLLEVKQSRTAASGDGDIERRVRESGRQRGGKLALQALDLVAHSPTGSRLVDSAGRNEVVEDLDHGGDSTPQ